MFDGFSDIGLLVNDNEEIRGENEVKSNDNETDDESKKTGSGIHGQVSAKSNNI